MGLETGTYIDSLVATNPVGSDAKSQGDDHIRLIKSTVKATFPNVSGAVTPTHTELNYVDGVTSAIQTQLNAKAPLASPTFTGTVTTAGQIAFPATQSASADANTLDDYEEGTFTPAISIGVDSPATGLTFTSRSGKYTKIGRAVSFSASLVVNAVGSSTGTLNITGLPFTSGATGIAPASLFVVSVTYTGQLAAYVGESENRVAISWTNEAGGTDVLTHSNLASGSQINVSGVYFV